MEPLFLSIVWSPSFVLLAYRYSGYQVTKMGAACSMYGEKRNTHRAIMNKAELKCLLVRPRRRWEDNSKIDLKVRTGLMPLRKGANFPLHKGRGVFLEGGLVEEMFASQEGIYWMKLVFKV